MAVRQRLAQIRTFEDTGSEKGAAPGYQEVVEAGDKASRVFHALRPFVGDSDMLVYPSMMPTARRAYAGR